VIISNFVDIAQGDSQSQSKGPTALEAALAGAVAEALKRGGDDKYNPKPSQTAPIFRALDTDAARGTAFPLLSIRRTGIVTHTYLFILCCCILFAAGGCVLSAAELDSSKEYIQLLDGSWTMLYQVGHDA
jgi:hypothetical protein